MKLKYFFQRDFRTSDNNSDPNLIVRHYRNDYNGMLKGIREMAQELALIELSYDEKYQEIQLLSNKQKYEVIITIMNVSAYEHAIGLVVNTFYLMPFGRGYKRICEIFEQLNKRLANIKKR